MMVMTIRTKNIKNRYWLISIAVFFIFSWADKAQAFTLGENHIFFVDTSYDISGRAQVSATLRQVGDHALFYTADDWWSSLSAADVETANAAILNLSGEFDKTIYPRLTRIFGSEWSPGIDRDLRISILITKINKSTGGYFNSADEYPQAQIANSNEREMIYLNSTYITSPLVKSFLAHEFQHMINFYQKEKLRNSVEDVWLNEARSEYASFLCGYDSLYENSNLERRVRDFLRYSTDPLAEWQNEPADYGAVNLFMHYLVSRYGEQILTKMTQTDAVGIASIDQALAISGFTERFKDIFTNWTVANYINDCQLAQGQKYCYLDPLLTYDRLHVRPQTSNLLSVKEGTALVFSDTIKDWSGRWYEILPQGSGLNLIIKVQGFDNSNLQAALVVFNKDGSKVIRLFNFDAIQSAENIISDFGDQVSGVALILSNQTKTSGFTASDPSYQFSYDAKITSASQLPVISPSPSAHSPIATTSPASSPAPQIVNPNFPDGSLIRVKDDAKVYIISGVYKRWLQSMQILTAYSHLIGQSIIEVTQTQADYYKEAWLIRADGDYKVYEINGDLTKHWLNMSADEFTNSGRSWDMVYIINARERDIYRTGAEVIR